MWPNPPNFSGAIQPAYIANQHTRNSVYQGNCAEESQVRRSKQIQLVLALEGASAGPQQVGLDPQTEVGRHGKLQHLEAVLFLAKDGLSLRKLARLAGLADATEARTLIRQLNEHLDDSGRSFRVEDIAGGYLLLTRPQFASWLRRFEHVPTGRRLSQTAMETLATVAYRQPVLRAEIEAIRGVNCSEILKQLMEYDLVRIHSRSEELGRPYLYGTTRRFLQMFGLRSIDRLPRMSWVNEPMSTPPLDVAEQSEAEDSSMTYTLSQESTALSAITDAVSEDLADNPALVDSSEQSSPTLAMEDEENGGFLEEEDDFDDDEDNDFEDDFEDDDDFADEEDDEDSDDDDEEENEWQEVDDDDDGWVDDDDDEEDDWDEDDEEEGDWD